MCVIVISPAGHNLPPKSDLRKMYNMNHDGCGFVSKSTTYHSMDFEDFYEHLKAVPKSEPVIIHFRWATHGSVNIKNTGHAVACCLLADLAGAIAAFAIAPIFFS